MIEKEKAATITEVQISYVMLIKLTLFALLLVAIGKLVPLIMLCFLSILLAVAAEPILTKLERVMPRWLSITLLMSAVIGGFGLIAFFVSPPFYEQAGRILQKAPQAGNSLLTHIPEGAFHNMAEKFIHLPVPNAESWGPRLLTMGELALGALSSIILIIVLMAYLLVDGKSTWCWLVAFFGADKRRKLEQTAEEVTPVISAYVVGQVITSVLCAIAVYIILKSLGVPAALVMAVLAAIFDVLPIIGFILTIVPACLFALTVSPSTALLVFFLFGAYHALENYVIVPTIYGNRLKLSGLVVLLAILGGVSLGGILGAILILPVIASYPLIERIWLSNYVGRRVINEHERIQNEGEAPDPT